jgi:hypothetical protein
VAEFYRSAHPAQASTKLCALDSSGDNQGETRRALGFDGRNRHGAWLSGIYTMLTGLFRPRSTIKPAASDAAVGREH